MSNSSLKPSLCFTKLIYQTLATYASNILYLERSYQCHPPPHSTNPPSKYSYKAPPSIFHALPLDRIGTYLIYLAIANHKDYHFKPIKFFHQKTFFQTHKVDHITKPSYLLKAPKKSKQMSICIKNPNSLEFTHLLKKHNAQNKTTSISIPKTCHPQKPKP